MEASDDGDPTSSGSTSQFHSPLHSPLHARSQTPSSLAVHIEDYASPSQKSTRMLASTLSPSTSSTANDADQGYGTTLTSFTTNMSNSNKHAGVHSQMRMHTRMQSSMDNSDDNENESADHGNPDDENDSIGGSWAIPLPRRPLHHTVGRRSGFLQTSSTRLIQTIHRIRPQQTRPNTDQQRRQQTPRARYRSGVSSMSTSASVSTASSWSPLSSASIRGYRTTTDTESPRRFSTNANEVLWGSDNIQDGKLSASSAARRTRKQRLEESFTSHEEETFVAKMLDFFFGFMYEDDEPTVPVDYYRRNDEPTVSLFSAGAWNKLNMALFAAYSLATLASMAPVILVPIISDKFHAADSVQGTAFASHAVASSVLGTACGKFLNGPAGDVFGARRTLWAYSMMLSLALMYLSASQSSNHALWGCFMVDFCQSVQWPCVLIILSSHYNSDEQRQRSFHEYENAINILSIAARLGSLVGISMFSNLLQTLHWRVVSLGAAWASLIASSIYFLYVTDSPDQLNAAKNGMDPLLSAKLESVKCWANPLQSTILVLRIFQSFIRKNLIPSLSMVLKSGAFWIFSLAHTGSSMIRSSDRMLGEYYYSTSDGTLTKNEAAGMAAYLSFGNIMGLLIGGQIFANQSERQRKWIVSRMYVVTICSVYALAFLGHSKTKQTINEPGLVSFLQVLFSFTMGCGIAIMLYILPGLAGIMFGSNTGLFASYSDGVAYAMASIVWRIVGSAVDSDQQGGDGWAYGWAAVALLMILCAVLMLEFLEHYFVRPSGQVSGTYETIILA